MLAIPTGLLAQSTWTVEALGGINSSTVNEAPIEGAYDSPLSPAGGIIIGKHFGNNWTLQLGAEFLQRSLHNRWQAPPNPRPREIYLDSASFNDVQKLNYLEFPLGLKFHVRFGSVRPFLIAGISPGIFVSGSNRIHLWDSTYASQNRSITDTMIDAGNAVNSFILSLLGGLGLEYQILPNSLFTIEAVYEYGLTTISNPAILLKEAPESENPYYLPAMTPLFSNDLKSRDFRVEAGVAIDL